MNARNLTTDYNSPVAADPVNSADDWRHIEGASLHYHVNSLGQVASIRDGKIRILSPTSVRGFLRFRLNKRWRYVARLVAEAFLGPAPFEYATVAHLNHDKSDNRARNLKWMSASESVSRFQAHVADIREIHLTESRCPAPIN